jgi:hypothetical protein
MAIPKTIANFETTLAVKIDENEASPTFSITSVTDKHGDTLADGVYAIIVNEGESHEEHLVGTLTASTKTFASVTRDVSVVDGETSKSTGREHRQGS